MHDYSYTDVFSLATTTDIATNVEESREAPLRSWHFSLLGTRVTCEMRSTDVLDTFREGVRDPVLSQGGWKGGEDRID